jgi:RNA polymerase sigma factor (sigma-70 family)
MRSALRLQVLMAKDTNAGADVHSGVLLILASGGLFRSGSPGQRRPTNDKYRRKLLALTVVLLPVKEFPGSRFVFHTCLFPREAVHWVSHFMTPTEYDFGALHGPAGAFHTTHWSVVLRAKDNNGSQADAAMERLCRAYWPPLYGFIRRQGHNVHDAQELTQEFLSRFVHREWLNHLHHQNGKFRSFLLTFLKHFLSDERDRAQAQKRGGGKQLVSLDEYAAEEQIVPGAMDPFTPDQAYERRWARALMDAALQQLQEEYTKRGNRALFEEIAALEPGKHGTKNYAEIAAELGTSEQVIKNAVQKFRRRYSEVLREKVAETVSTETELEEEIRHLRNVFTSG